MAALETAIPDVRTPPIVKVANTKPLKSEDLKKFQTPAELPKPVMVSATVSTHQDDEDHTGFQGVAEPVVIQDESLEQSIPVGASNSLGASITPADLKKTNGSAAMTTTAEPQHSTTASDRISTWILLSGTNSAVTTPTSLKKRPQVIPTNKPQQNSSQAHAQSQHHHHSLQQQHQEQQRPQDNTIKTSSAPSTTPHSPPAPSTPAPYTTAPPAPTPSAPSSPAVFKPHPARQPATRKPAPASKPAVKKQPTTTTTSTTAASVTTPQTSTEYVKISEAVVSSQKTKLPATALETNKKVLKPLTNADANLSAVKQTPGKRPVHPIQDKTKHSSATVPFSPAISFRRKPIQGPPIHANANPVKVNKGPKPLKTASPSTTTTATPDEVTTIPSTTIEASTLAEDANLITTTLPPVTSKKPKRTNSSTKKKKKKNKTRRRRPAKKPATGSDTSTTGAPESKIGNEGVNITKVPGQNGISTKIYNYLAREVMPSVSVGIIGLVVTAGIAGLFLYPFGGGIAARRTYDEAHPDHQTHPDHMYYYENYAEHAMEGGKPEEEVLGHVFQGMEQPAETRYAASPAIYGGGEEGPPDAQYPETYSRYDSSGKGSTFGRPEGSASDDLRQGTGYSSVSVNGHGQVTGYADAPPGSSPTDSKYETLTPSNMHRTNYEVDTPVDQVDLTYAAAGDPASDSVKKTEEMPFVVGSSAVTDSAQNPGVPGNRYRVGGGAANVDITYGSGESVFPRQSTMSDLPENHAKDGAVHSASYSAIPSDSKPGTRYSVRVSGDSGQVALAYGSSADQREQDNRKEGISKGPVKLDQASSVQMTYGAGLDSDSRYATANGAQPRAISTQRRRRSTEFDAYILNEIDAPLSSPDVNDLKMIASSEEPARKEATTDLPDDLTTTSEETGTTLVPEISDKGYMPVSGNTDNDPDYVSPTDIPGVTSAPANNGTGDPFTSLMNIFRRVAEFKLRVGLSLLRSTSEAVTRYIGGVTRRMEQAAEDLSAARNERTLWTSKVHRRTARAAFDRAKQQLKKTVMMGQKKD